MVLEKGRFKQIHEWYNHQGFDVVTNNKNVPSYFLSLRKENALCKNVTANKGR